MVVLLTNPATRVSVDEKYEKFFIKAGSRWPWTIVKKKDEKNTNIFFPFYLAYTANILRQRGHKVYVIDGVAMDIQDNEFLSRVQRINPDVLVIETQTHAFDYDVILCKKIKDLIPDTSIILTGAHVTVFAKEILNNIKVVDFVILGEYEFTVGEIVDRIGSDSKDFKIEASGYRLNNEIWVSNKKGFIEDINTLPYPAFDLFPCNERPDLAIYGDGICTYRPAVTLHSSRGCPFKCDFCLWNQVMYDNGPYRMFSPKRVVDEMEFVINNYGAKEIYFDDDDYCINKKHVLEICNEIKRRRIKIKWSCMGDAMCTDEEMIKAMANAGCIFMKFGVESGSREILRNIGKPLNPEKAIEISKLCWKHKIRTHATFSFGLDGDTLETMKNTLRLANKINFDYAQASITTPFPGTAYYEKLIKRSELKELKWEKFDGTSTCSFSTSQLTAEDIEKFRKRAIRSMVLHKILSPIWLWRFFIRNILLIQNYDLRTALIPLKALISLK